MKRIDGVDGLRAIAVIFVLIQHQILGYIFHIGGDFGEIGVSVFFVISGFLITSILIKEKYSVNNSNIKKIIKFYIRRFLRIFPIYYLTISIGILSGIYWFQYINPLWYYGYAINVYIAIKNGWIGYVGHFWSLCVEEQFYLLWPALILLIPKKYLKHLIIITILIGFFTPMFQQVLWLQGVRVYVLPFQHLFALGLGALLAYFYEFYSEVMKKVNMNIMISYFVIIFLFLFGSFWLVPDKINDFAHFILFWVVDILVVMLIHNMIAGYLPNFVKIMEFYPIKLIGKTSYGIYLYHNLVPELYTKTIFSPLLPPSLLHLFVYLITTGVIATFSWILIEKPCNNLKEPLTNWVFRLLRFQ